MNRGDIHNREFEKILDKRAKEDLEKKAMEQARNERNYELYMQKRERAVQKARRKIKRQEMRGPVIFTVIVIIFIAFLYLEQSGIHIQDLVSTLFK